MIQGRDPNVTFRWQHHGSNDKEQCRVVSLRAIEANLSMDDPKFGNRLLVQALVKFDTNQVHTFLTCLLRKLFYELTNHDYCLCPLRP